jgi:hypothetical protein
LPISVRAAAERYCDLAGAPRLRMHKTAEDAERIAARTM